MKKICYFFNVGFVFDKNNKKDLYDCRNNNQFCCKSDLCNGLWCSEYGIEFNKQNALNFIKEQVENGGNDSYGFIKEVEVDLDNETWKKLFNNLVKNYNYKNLEDAQENGYIPYEYGDIIDDFSSYWEQPDISYLRDGKNILKNKLEILKEKDLNPETIKWINEELYGIVKSNLGEEL